MTFLQGWYIVTYALGIYLLNLFIAFLTPKIDPALPDSSDGKHDLYLTDSKLFFIYSTKFSDFLQELNDGEY